MKDQFNYFCETGPREKNEDIIAMGGYEGKRVFVVCDGMGGHDSGEIASETIAGAIIGYFDENYSEPLSEQKILNACNAADKALNEYTGVQMGSTLAAVAYSGAHAILAHCGDTRIYVIRNQKIIYQSVDHVALTSAGEPIITRGFFSGQNKFTPEVHEMYLMPYDIIFICTDGVFGNGKWSRLQDELTKLPIDMEAIYNLTNENAHDNFSGLIIVADFDIWDYVNDPNVIGENSNLQGFLYEYILENTKELGYELEDFGEGIKLANESVDGWWKTRFLLNSKTKEAHPFIGPDLTLMNVEDDDIDWKSIPVEYVERVRRRCANYPTNIRGFHQGRAEVDWQINPDGRYYMDDDGFGMTDDEEFSLRATIDTNGKYITKFTAK